MKKLSRRIITGMLVIALSVSTVLILDSNSEAEAQTCDTVYYSTNDILFYNPCETCSTSGQAIAGTGNEDKVYTWLIGKGFNAAQAAGMMGNIAVESAFNPFRMQTTYSNQGINTVLPPLSHKEYNRAFGLVQWDGGRRSSILKQITERFPDHINEINMYGKSADGYKNAGTANDTYLALELEYMYQELENGYKSVFRDIKAQPDSEVGATTVADIWNRRYEVSADRSQDRPNRAKAYYAQFKDTVIAQSAGGQCSSGEPAGKVVHYLQSDARWASLGYAGGKMDDLGCGPTSMAMILASLVDKNITPADVAAVAGVQVGFTNHAELIRGVNAKWGLNISTNSVSLDTAIDFVKAGKGYVWVGGKGSVPFTTAGHMVAFVGVTSDDRLTVADPAGDLPGHSNVSNISKGTMATNGFAYYLVEKK